jgi:hypothetical protein
MNKECLECHVYSAIGGTAANAKNAVKRKIKVIYGKAIDALYVVKAGH